VDGVEDGEAMRKVARALPAELVVIVVVLGTTIEGKELGGAPAPVIPRKKSVSRRRQKVQGLGFRV
jgi:hypothetical protein